MLYKEIAAFLLIEKEGEYNGTMVADCPDSRSFLPGLQWVLGMDAEPEGQERRKNPDAARTGARSNRVPVHEIH